jgi:hypothetical protein
VQRGHWRGHQVEQSQGHRGRVAVVGGLRGVDVVVDRPSSYDLVDIMFAVVPPPPCTSGVGELIGVRLPRCAHQSTPLRVRWLLPDRLDCGRHSVEVAQARPR